MEFSQRLNYLMDDKKVSAYQMGKATHISDRLIGYWRKGEKVPGAESLLAVADYFGVSVDYLLGRTDDPNMHPQQINYGNVHDNDNSSISINSHQPHSSQLDPTSRQILETFNQLELPDKTAVLTLLSELSKRN